MLHLHTQTFQETMTNNKRPFVQSVDTIDDCVIYASRKKQRQNPNPKCFIQKLWTIVNSEHNFIEWTDEGTAFKIHNLQQFAEYTLPKYFKHNKYTSFVRQLNHYGFSKNCKKRRRKSSDCEKNYDIWMHQYFTMDRPDLLPHIQTRRERPCSKKYALEQLTQEIMSLRQNHLRLLDRVLYTEQKILMLENYLYGRFIV